MSFPIIDTIDDVLPSIEGRDEFKVARKDGYTVIDYVFAKDDTFSSPMDLECRGLKFGADGHIISRPFHKFFNLGERPDLQIKDFDVTEKHEILEKMDGSMIHGAVVNGEFVFMTRMGHTDVAKKAERHITPELRAECLRLSEQDITPIFEWTAPDNRIVVKYKSSSLTLLALRDIHYGNYYQNSAVRAVAARMGVQSVKEYPVAKNAKEFIEYARSLPEQEGFVVKVETHGKSVWFKLKADAYVRKHKAKEALNQEKNVIRLILNNELDDVLPILDKDQMESVLNYQKDLRNGISESGEFIDRIVRMHSDLSQKDFATKVVQKHHLLARPLMFKVRASNDNNTEALIAETILGNTGSQTKVDQYRDLHEAIYHAV